jgi:uncharacterized zinc-type alcohol dehydrogenase-like protein
MFNAKAYSAANSTSPLAPTVIARRDPTENDVRIEILFCGICHSDLHYSRNEWSSIMTTVYPCVPGHEIVGRVKAVGSAAAKFKKGDLVGVGCLVDSDGTCPSCKAGLEQFCPNQVWTYGGQDKHLGGTTLGGYSDTIVVDEKFVLRVPENLDLAAVAPLLCAGITTYSPLRHWGVGPGKKVGIVGLGGLGHMGVKFAHASVPSGDRASCESRFIRPSRNLESRSESDGTPSGIPIQLCSDILERILKCSKISCGTHRRG